MKHRVKQYADGFRWIDYCTVCGKEGSELICEPECVVDKKVAEQSDFLIDNDKEQN